LRLDLAGPDQDLEDLNAAHPELARLNANDEVDSPASQERKGDSDGPRRKRKKKWTRVSVLLLSLRLVKRFSV